MTHRATITLDEEAHTFLQAAAGKNRSAFINALIRKERDESLARDLSRANREEAEDEVYQSELRLWDVTHPDGLPT